jgi:hypothetical protein
VIPSARRGGGGESASVWRATSGAGDGRDKHRRWARVAGGSERHKGGAAMLSGARRVSIIYMCLRKGQGS